MFFLHKPKTSLYGYSTFQSQGSIPVISILLFIYIFIFSLFHIYWAPSFILTDFSRIEHPENERVFERVFGKQFAIEEAWLEPIFQGISRIQYFEIVNALFIIYVLLSFLIFVTNKGKKHFYKWASYAFCFYSLIMLQIYFHKIDYLAHNIRELLQ